MIFLLFLSFVSTLAHGVQTGHITPPSGGARSNIYNLPGFTWKTCASNSQCDVVALLNANYSVDIEEVLDIEGIPGEKGAVRYYKVSIFSDEPLKIGYVPASYITLNEPLSSPCQKRRYSDFVKEMKVITEQAKPKPASTSTALIPPLADWRKFNDLCKNIIDENGNVGPWGQMALRAFDRAGSDCFYKTLNVANVCPKYSGFPHAKKQQFLLYSLASIAVKESSCDPNAYLEEGTNGPADGLFMHEFSKSLRVRSDRDPNMCRTDSGIETKDLKFQFECTAAIIRDNHCKRQTPFASENSYWEQLKSSGRQIGRLIKQFPGCL